MKQNVKRFAVALFVADGERESVFHRVILASSHDRALRAALIEYDYYNPGFAVRQYSVIEIKQENSCQINELKQVFSTELETAVNSICIENNRSKTDIVQTISSMVVSKIKTMLDETVSTIEKYVDNRVDQKATEAIVQMSILKAAAEKELINKDEQ